MSLILSLDSAGDFIAEIPGARPHRVRIPLSMPGMMFLRRLLVEQESHPDATVGTPAAPTQADIDLWIAKYKERNPPPVARPVAPDFLNIELDF